ncbi:tyrosine-type recombinase/integrase [Thermococcus sp.]
MAEGVIRVGFSIGNAYEFSSNDVRAFLKEYMRESNVTRDTARKVEKFLWEFVGFLQGREIVKGNTPHVPRVMETYIVDREKIIDYINALRAAGYSNEAIRKRIPYIKKMLNMFGIHEFDFLLTYAHREFKSAVYGEREENGVVISLKDVRKFFRRLEKLYKEGKISEEKYLKMITFAILMISTGRRKEEIAKIRIDWIEIDKGIVKFPTESTKEGKILKTNGYFKVTFLTKEAREVLECYIRKFKREIKNRKGYLFVSPDKKDTSTIFANRLMNKYANVLKFTLSDGNHRMELMHLRKFFAQEWERRAGQRGMTSERVDTVKRRLMGHRLGNDIHRSHYARLSVEEMREIYNKIYYDLEVLTKEQKKMIRNCKEKIQKVENLV